jgi:class 3 adenylate cyclase
MPQDLDAAIGSAGRNSTPASIRHRLANSTFASFFLLLLVLAGLPLALWVDLRQLSESALNSQVNSLASVIGSFRSYYANNVVGRILAHPGETKVLPNFEDVPGAIPIPATLSLGLGELLSKANSTTHMGYRFFSDYPFANRAAHQFDAFERHALTALRENKQSAVYNISGSMLDRRVRLITPVVMSGPCVACHNTHPDSPKRDWKVNDVRGIEEFTVSQPLASNIFAFKYLLIYFLTLGAVGLTFISLQRHQSAVIAQINHDLSRSNKFLTTIAQKLAKYLSPEHYRSIFSGEKDVVVSTERKKLTIVFSDIVGFTSVSEHLQPEELTAVLNEYFTEMSQIATRHGGTVNKFIGDAMLILFGDIATRGVTEDARASLQMAFEMQGKLAELNVRWRKRGIKDTIQSRIGINTGYCNVGNFGSDERMDYTIVGAEANLAARLQSIADPGQIILSYETFVLVSDMVKGHALTPITLKGISRQIVPYTVERNDGLDPSRGRIFAAHRPGLDLLLDVTAIDPTKVNEIAHVLQEALIAVEKTSSEVLESAAEP